MVRRFIFHADFSSEFSPSLPSFPSSSLRPSQFIFEERGRDKRRERGGSRCVSGRGSSIFPSLSPVATFRLNPSGRLSFHPSLLSCSPSSLPSSIPSSPLHSLTTKMAPSSSKLKKMKAERKALKQVRYLISPHHTSILPLSTLLFVSCVRSSFMVRPSPLPPLQELKLLEESMPPEEASAKLLEYMGQPPPPSVHSFIHSFPFFHF